MNYPKYLDKKGNVIRVGDTVVAKSFSGNDVEITVKGIHTGRSTYAQGMHLPTEGRLYDARYYRY